MLIQGQVEQSITALRQAGPANLQLLQLGELGVSEVLPRYGALTWSGLVYSVGQTAAAALTAVGTTTTGLTLWNPLGSGKNLMLIDVTGGVTPVTLATVGIQVMLGGGLQTATPTFGSTLTPVNNLLGGGPSIAKAGTGSTTIAQNPNPMRCIGSWESTVLTTSGGATATATTIKDEIAGLVIVPPGQVITLYGIGTVADATVNAVFTWAELPV